MARYGGGFYLGEWYVPRYNKPEQQSWLWLTDSTYAALKATQNVETIRMNPEDMDLDPEDIQAEAAQWVTFTNNTSEFYSFNRVTEQSGYYIYSYTQSGYYIF